MNILVQDSNLSYKDDCSQENSITQEFKKKFLENTERQEEYDPTALGADNKTDSCGAV